MRTIPKNCLHCQGLFEASLKEHNRGNAKFCSLVCSHTHRKGVKVSNREPNFECATCSIPFYRSPSKSKNSKHGYQFCSRVCKEQAQRIDNPNNITVIMPSHYGSGASVYRDVALRHKPMVCEDCGFDRVPEILQVHHIDRNRKNGHITNLKILCPNCHDTDHFINGDGRFAGRNGGGGEERSPESTVQR